jgi:cell division protein FtsN
MDAKTEVKVPPKPVDNEPAPAATTPSPKAAKISKFKPRLKPLPRKAVAAAQQQATGARVWHIQVGLFKDPGNVVKVQAQLEGLGLPAQLQSMAYQGQSVTRIRAGSYASAAQAQQAARHVQSVGLPAVVVGAGGQAKLAR